MTNKKRTVSQCHNNSKKKKLRISNYNNNSRKNKFNLEQSGGALEEELEGLIAGLITSMGPTTLDSFLKGQGQGKPEKIEFENIQIISDTPLTKLHNKSGKMGKNFSKYIGNPISDSFKKIIVRIKDYKVTLGADAGERIVKAFFPHIGNDGTTITDKMFSFELLSDNGRRRSDDGRLYNDPEAKLKIAVTNHKGKRVVIDQSRITLDNQFVNKDDFNRDVANKTKIGPPPPFPDKSFYLELFLYDDDFTDSGTNIWNAEIYEKFLVDYFEKEDVKKIHEKRFPGDNIFQEYLSFKDRSFQLMGDDDKKKFRDIVKDLIKIVNSPEFKKDLETIGQKYDSFGDPKNIIARTVSSFRNRLSGIQDDIDLKQLVGDRKIMVKGPGTGSTAEMQAQIDKINKVLERLLNKDKINKLQLKDNEGVIRIIKPKDAIVGLSHGAANSFDEAVTLFFQMFQTQLKEDSDSKIKDNLSKIEEHQPLVQETIDEAEKIFDSIKDEYNIDFSKKVGVELEITEDTKDRLKSKIKELDNINDKLYQHIQTILNSKKEIIKKLKMLSQFDKNNMKGSTPSEATSSGSGASSGGSNNLSGGAFSSEKIKNEFEEVSVKVKGNKAEGKDGLRKKANQLLFNKNTETPPKYNDLKDVEEKILKPYIEIIEEYNKKVKAIIESINKFADKVSLINASIVATKLKFTQKEGSKIKAKPTRLTEYKDKTVGDKFTKGSKAEVAEMKKEFGMSKEQAEKEVMEEYTRVGIYNDHAENKLFSDGGGEKIPLILYFVTAETENRYNSLVELYKNKGLTPETHRESNLDITNKSGVTLPTLKEAEQIAKDGGETVEKYKNLVDEAAMANSEDSVMKKYSPIEATRLQAIWANDDTPDKTKSAKNPEIEKILKKIIDYHAKGFSSADKKYKKLPNITNMLAAFEKRKKGTTEEQVNQVEKDDLDLYTILLGGKKSVNNKKNKTRIRNKLKSKNKSVRNNKLIYYGGADKTVNDNIQDSQEALDEINTDSLPPPDNSSQSKTPDDQPPEPQENQPQEADEEETENEESDDEESEEDDDTDDEEKKTERQEEKARESVTPTPDEAESGEETTTPTPGEGEGEGEEAQESATSTPGEGEGEGQEAQESATPAPGEGEGEGEEAEESATSTPGEGEGEGEETEESATPTPGEGEGEGEGEEAEESASPTPGEGEGEGEEAEESSTPTPGEGEGEGEEAEESSTPTPDEGEEGDERQVSTEVEIPTGIGSSIESMKGDLTDINQSISSSQNKINEGMDLIKQGQAEIKLGNESMGNEKIEQGTRLLQRAESQLDSDKEDLNTAATNIDGNLLEQLDNRLGNIEEILSDKSQQPSVQPVVSKKDTTKEEESEESEDEEEIPDNCVKICSEDNYDNMPSMMNPAMMNPAMMNPAMMNPAMMNPAMFNPAMFNPAMMNPAMMNPAMMNPAMMNPAMFNPYMLYGNNITGGNNPNSGNNPNINPIINMFNKTRSKMYRPKKKQLTKKNSDSLRVSENS